VYPKCSTQKCCATTHINEPIEHQPPLEPPSAPNGEEIEDNDDPPPSHPITPALRQTYPKQKGKSPPHTPIKEGHELLLAPLQPPHSPQRCREPPPPPEQPCTPPVPVRQLQQLQKAPVHPDNVYGEDRPPMDIEKDIQQPSQWKRMVKHDLGSSHTHDLPDIPATREHTPPAQSDEPLHQSEDDCYDSRDTCQSAQPPRTGNTDKDTKHGPNGRATEATRREHVFGPVGRGIMTTWSSGAYGPH
jgi:hypothetical protein